MEKNNNFAPEELKEILSFLESTDLEFVQIERDGKKIVLRRSNAHIANLQTAAAQSEIKPEEKEAESPKTCSIRSPIVGRFYSSMGADRPALVVESGRVTAGQKVAIVEAMKIKKEVFSPCTGIVTRILARNGDPVEYGQELFTVSLEEGKDNV